MRSYLPVTLAFLLTACAGSVLEPVNPPRPLTEFTPQLKVEPLWSAELRASAIRHYLRLQPLLDGERVYLVHRKGRVEARDAASGQLLWRVALDQPISGGIGDGGDRLLLGSDAEVVAIAKRDGHVMWRSPVSSEVVATPMRDGDNVYIRTMDGKLESIDLDDGQPHWRFAQSVPTLSLHGAGDPLPVGDLVITGFANGKLVAVSRNGELRWEISVGSAHGRNELERLVDVDAYLAHSAGIIYAAGFQGRLVAVVAADGQLLWTRDISSHSGLDVVGDVLYISDEYGDLWALSRINGASLWKQDLLHGRRLSAPVAQGNYLLVGDFEGYLHWFDRSSGKPVARARIEDEDYYFPIKDAEEESDHDIEDRGILASPVVGGGRVYAVDAMGVVGAFKVSQIDGGKQ